jgi:transcription antitermination factor NusG
MLTADTERPMTVRSALFDEAAAGLWYVLHTKSRQEKILAWALEAMNVACFLPLVRQVRYYGQHKATVELPLFPSYVFMRGQVDDVYRADRTKRVAKVIPVPDQCRLEWELRNVNLALQRDVQFDPFPHLVKGTRVEVRSGPLRGLQGLVEERVKPNRLILQVEMLGRAVSLEVDASLLDRVE